MLCLICGKNHANTFISKNINGIMSNIAVCNDCFSKTQFSKFFINDFVKEKECPNCKTTISKINKSGRLGCYQCYETFNDNILASLERVQIDTTHVGKTPKSNNLNPIKANEQPDKCNLQEQMKQAIKDENFEKAALIRDMIKEMEAKNNG